MASASSPHFEQERERRPSRASGIFTSIFTSATGTGELRPVRWSAQQVASVGAVWVLGAILLAVMSVAAHANPHGAFIGDAGLEEWIQKLQQPALVRFINFASDANWPKPAGIIAITVIVALAIARRFRAAFCTAFSGFGADFLNVTLNGIVKRERPHGVHIHAVAHLGLFSFPSGHVTHVTAFYGFLLYLTFEGMRAHPSWRPLLWIVRIICVYFIVFISISRVLEGEHWPSDVFAGYVLGALTLTLAIAVYHGLTIWWQRMRDRRNNGTLKNRLAPAAV